MEDVKELTNTILCTQGCIRVSILVLMEDVKELFDNKKNEENKMSVSILVLMEDVKEQLVWDFQKDIRKMFQSLF